MEWRVVAGTVIVEDIWLGGLGACGACTLAVLLDRDAAMASIFYDDIKPYYAHKNSRHFLLHLVVCNRKCLADQWVGL